MTRTVTGSLAAARCGEGAGQRQACEASGGDAIRTTGLVFDGGGNVDSGSVTKQWTYGSSTNLLWTFTAL
ncbi:hypothetical protein [Streptomyces sp. NBC_01483]|uniref:hypothetical protein n=1 Tax=Streptomyces sp. NBC_01483 TaxID=2903883 RepID=UPI002E2F4A86|nr:hypothetical protein [Streptomyces sp. NBC_01483]